MTSQAQTALDDQAGNAMLNLLTSLTSGDYALVVSISGKTELRQLTKSHGTDFYKFVKIVDISPEQLNNYSPHRTIALNASPAGSESQEYVDALVFSI